MSLETSMKCAVIKLSIPTSLHGSMPYINEATEGAEKQINNEKKKIW